MHEDISFLVAQIDESLPMKNHAVNRKKDTSIPAVHIWKKNYLVPLWYFFPWPLGGAIYHEFNTKSFSKF